LTELSKSIAKAINKQQHELIKTSLSSPFLQAGERTLKKAFSEATKLEESERKQAINKELSSWFLHTAMEDKSQMFSGADIDEIMRSYKQDKQDEENKKAKPKYKEPTVIDDPVMEKELDEDHIEL